MSKVDFTKPVFWGDREIVREVADSDTCAWVFKDKTLGTEFEIPGEDSCAYEFLYITTDGSEANYGWSSYDPLPITNGPAVDPFFELKQILRKLRKEGHTIKCKVDVKTRMKI